MRIFITGGSGLLGHRIAEIALEKGYEVYSGYCHNHPSAGKPVKIDLSNPVSIFETIKDAKPDVIMHTAALTNVDKCEKEKELAFRINVEGTKAIAEAVRKLNSFLIYVSTDYVFDGRKGMYREEDETNPVNYYGHTKLLGEQYCKDFCIARTCVIYGAKPASGKVNFVLWLIDKLRNGEKVRIVTDQYITPTLNTNLAKMMLEIAEKGLKGVFHLAGATRVSRFEFAETLADVFGLDKTLITPSKMEEINWVAVRPKDSSLDTSKAVKLLDEKPYALEKALKVLKEEMS
ncbi:dTDP-4-dehydrorhamnose reductase [Archaeoglobus veneficus]|uniref:dTDP-4-dehydrorhamnose reductase n=1 Tax=Archaeoglobus veneficus (strain DSM 11195 / SNP6) TaxID=693661 RepID=F2KQD7_ARCVS|nr:dTDP-4-dehydrorhamnose reductase [Archaeoglobus veneficus]AEA46570.1 dTDP-4-dehydrorhamnose reductase [Archaeoglobus veneficus SNP6]